MDSHYTPAGKCRFTPLYGASIGAPICYMLQVNEFTLLLDCGWNDSFDVKLLQPVIDVVEQVDAIVLSHPDTCHLGALPYLVGKCGLKAPVYATYPVFKMGQMFMYDHCHTRQESEDFGLFTLDDVDAAFKEVVRLRYHQTHKLGGKGSGISLTPYAAGHMIGGSVWRITVHEEEVVYAMDYNHTKEHHLNGTSLPALFSRPTLMVTDSAGAAYKAPDRGRRDNQFFDLILRTLRADGNVLLPVDTAGRVLELMLLLDKYWHENKLVYPLVLLSSVATTVVQFAKSCLDWLNDSLARTFQHYLENPFTLRYMKLCTSRGALGALPHGPKLVLASTPSLDVGFSRTLLFEWASDPRNIIIFTLPPQANTLAATLLEHARKHKPPNKPANKPATTTTTTTTTAAISSAVGAPGTPAPMEVDNFGQQGRTGGLGGDREAGGRDMGEALVVEMKMSRRVFLEGEELESWRKERELERNGGVAPEENMELGQGSQKEGSSGWDKPARTSSGVLSRLGRTVSGGVSQSDLEEVAAQPEGADILLDGFTSPPDAVAAMFPDEDEPFTLAWDEYGAMLDESEFKTMGPGAAEAVVEEEAPAPVEERPTKLVTVDASVTVRAQITYFDYEGRSDGISVSTFLNQIAPQHLVLVHGTKAGSEKLAQQYQTDMQQLCTALYQPADGDSVELPLTASFRTLMSDPLVACIHPHRLGQYSLAWVEGLLKQYTKTDPLVLEPARNQGLGGANHGGIFIGDVKLSDVKQALEAQQMDAHFGFGGTLVCQGGQVLIKKGEQSGHLILEGAMSESYYRVRDALYGQYNIC